MRKTENIDLARLSAEDVLDTDMILTSDVHSVKGILIALKGMKINKKNFERLQKYGINIVNVDKPENYTIPYCREEITSEVLKNNTEFITFKNAYEHAQRVIENLIDIISFRKSIDFHMIFRIIDSLVDSVANKSSIFIYMAYIKGDNDDTNYHSINVALLANIFCRWMNMNSDEIEIATLSGVLHDIGNIKLPTEIITKPGLVTADEFKAIKKHPIYGHDLLKDHEISQEIKNAVLQHHELVNGKGYPIGLSKDRINFYAKLISICGIYDALTSNRVYRAKLSPFDVVYLFETDMYDQLDPKLLLIFLKNIVKNYIGVWVNLSSGNQAEVVYINNMGISRPIVRTIEGKLINLLEVPEVKILSLI